MLNHGIGAKTWPIVNLFEFFLQRIILQFGVFDILNEFNYFAVGFNILKFLVMM
jgi:hypothetical protein